CQPGTTEQACGASGACGSCSMGQVCKGQSCAACGAPGQICCAGQACGGARTCLDGLCLREITFDCLPTPTSLTGEVVFNETTTLSTASTARGRVGHYPILTSHMWHKYFVTFDCTGAPGPAGLQQATLSLWQTAYNAAPGDRLTVEHLAYATLDYAEFLTKPLDAAGSLAAANTTGYQTLDVTTSMQRDLVDGRSPTQFRLDLPTADMTSNHYVEFETAIQSHPPKLQLRYRSP
ncbi:MAG TPA: hypothetical protein VN914_14265, partial [Polyangia bacterium]|nr:hypothetical protein [Polyangia bacterium]